MKTDTAAVRQTIHDLNNTLTVILTAADLISNDAPESGQIRSDAQSIRTSAIRARDLVEELRGKLGLT